MKKEEKVKVTILQSVAGTGDPSPADLKRKYELMTVTMTQHSLTAQKAGKQGRTDEEIAAIVETERRKDARTPRLAGFDHEFSFKPKDVALIDADLAEKWQDAGICIIEESAKKAA
jgi:hypothetical protein